MHHGIVYVVYFFQPDLIGMTAQEFFDRTEAEAARERHNARGPGHYARPVEERPYNPIERKSNFFGPPVRWDMPPATISHFVPMSEHHERYYGEK